MNEIWFVNTCAPEKVGGGETTLRAWTDGFQQQGYKVRWFYPGVGTHQGDDHANTIPEGVNLSPLAALSARMPTAKAVDGFMGFAKCSMPSAVIYNGFSNFSIPLLLGSRHLGLNTICVFHGELPNKIYPGRPHWSLVSLAREVMLKKLYNTYPNLKVVSVSGFVDEQLTNSRRWVRTSTIIYPPTLEHSCPSVHAPKVDTKTIANPVASTVSRISPEKGLGELSELAKAAQNTGLAWQFNVAGPTLRASYANCLTKSKPDNLSLVGPKLGPELCSLYAGADILVMPSPSEGFGLVIVEAMTHGLPVLARGNPAAAEIYKWFGSSKQPGHLAPIEKEEFIYDSLQYLMAFQSDPQIRAEAAACAREIPKYYNPRKQVKEFVNLVLGQD